LYNKHNIKEVLFVNFLIFVAKWIIWKFRNDIKYNNKKFDTLKIKQMLKIELKSNTALITKSLLLNKNIGKLLFENLQKLA
jgi:regulatory protein YycH of two-component signal transduction system YycFG